MNILLSPYFLVILSSILCALLWLKWKTDNDTGYFVGFVCGVLFNLFYIIVGWFELDSTQSRLLGRWVFSFIESVLICYTWINLDKEDVLNYLRGFLWTYK